MKFFKYQGAGNDFVLIDNRDLQFNANDTALVAQLCDRRFGVGADGLMLLQQRAGYDFEMVYYNADGNPGSMCGNGGRCIVSFAKHLGIIDRSTRFLAVDGEHEATINDAADWVSLKMIDVDGVNTDGEDFVLNTGSPHYVKIVNNLKELDVFTAGRAIRYNDSYREAGINVNFAEAIEGGYQVRTYERGVEDETLACGTGVTAVAIAMAWHNNQLGELHTPVKAMGGDLTIRFFHLGDGVFKDIYLEGPAKLVFEGFLS